MAQTLDFLRGEYDYVLVDCASTLDDTNMAVIEASNQVYLVATPEIGAIRDLSRLVDNLSQNDHNGERVKAHVDQPLQLAARGESGTDRGRRFGCRWRSSCRTVMRR